MQSDMKSIFSKHVIYSITDLNGYITDVSDAFCVETGYTRDEIIGKTHSLLRAPNFPDEVYTQLWDTITQDRVWEGKINNIRKNSEPYWVHCIIEPMFDEDNKKIAYISLRQNITKEKTCEALSHIDELTGVYNRRKFNMELNNFLINYYRYDYNFSVIMIDIDHFKNFNDTYGHLVGDEVLKQVCNVIKSNIREGDFFSRWGGEEFILIFNKANKDISCSACQKLLNIIRIDLSLYLLKNFNIKEPLTCSMGVTSPQKSDSLDTIIKRVDSALYLAKDNGRNRVEIL